MALVPTSGPALEPITLAEAKAYLRVDGADDDTLIGALIATSRLHIEAALGCALITQGWSLYRDDWPLRGPVRLPLSPLQSIDAVRLYALDGSTTLLAQSSYQVDAIGTPPRMVRLPGSDWPKPGRPVNGIEIAFTAGYGATPSAVPAPIRHALLLLVAHWYENREPVKLIGGGFKPMRIPDMVSELMLPYRAGRP